HLQGRPAQHLVPARVPGPSPLGRADIVPLGRRQQHASSSAAGRRSTTTSLSTPPAVTWRVIRGTPSPAKDLFGATRGVMTRAGDHALSARNSPLGLALLLPPRLTFRRPPVL